MVVRASLRVFRVFYFFCCYGILKFMAVLISIFNQYGAYFFVALLIADVVLAVWVFLMRRTMKKIFRAGTMDIERVILEIHDKQNAEAKSLEQTANRVAVLESALPKDIRKVGLVRYNPFSDAGGDQSFALALLNDHKDGIVLSSLYGREMNRVYAKLIEKGASKYQLSQEELQAIEKAMA